MNRNVSEREEADRIAMDFDDILVQSVDGLITGGDDEVKSFKNIFNKKYIIN